MYTFAKNTSILYEEIDIFSKHVTSPLIREKHVLNGLKVDERKILLITI